MKCVPCLPGNTPTAGLRAELIAQHAAQLSMVICPVSSAHARKTTRIFRAKRAVLGLRGSGASAQDTKATKTGP